MRFALHQAFRRLISRKGYGTLELGQLILSFFLMTCCLNLFNSAMRLKTREDISDSNASCIQWMQRTNGGMLQNGYAGCTDDDYHEICRMDPSINLVYATWYNTLVEPQYRTETLKDIDVIFAPRMSIKLLGESVLADADAPIYHASAIGMSSEAASALERAKSAGECYVLNPGSIAQNLLRNGYVREDVSFSNVFVVPMEYMTCFNESDIMSVYLLSGFASPETSGIVQLLYRNHPTGFEYYVLPMNAKVSVSLDRASDQARDFMLYSILLLIAVSVGLIGSILMHSMQRSKEYAILRCLGVPERLLMFESIMEMVIPFLFSGIAGAVLGEIVSPLIVVGEMNVHASNQAAVIPIFFALCIGVLLSLLLLWKQRHTEMSAMLRCGE